MQALATRGKRHNKRIQKNGSAPRAIRMAVHGAVEMLEQRVLFSTLIVNSTDDNITDTSVLTLREAIGLVNSAGDPTALGQPTIPAGWMSQISGAFGTNDKIEFDSTVFPAGSLTTITLDGSPLVFTNTATPVTVAGPGANQVEINGNAATNDIVVSASVTASFSGMTVTGGQALGGGAGIFSHGTVNLTGMAISGNMASSTDGTSTFGGGITEFSGSMVIDSSTISGNMAIGGDGSPLSNAAGIGYGGGIYLGSGTLTVINSTIANNTAQSGNSTGIAETAKGGGFYSAGGTATFTDDTISGNQAQDAAGSIKSTQTYGGGMFVNGGAVTVGNTIIAGNQTTSNLNPDVAGPFTSAGDNLIGNIDGNFAQFPATGFSATLGDQIGTNATPIDPGLNPLGSYGGTTQTMPLKSTSPALKAAAPVPGIIADQRGFGPRPANPDIGAYQTGVVAAVSTVGFTGSIQTYVVPTTGIYAITLAGAQGGDSSEPPEFPLDPGGLGAVFSGDVSLTAGTVLQVVVGGQGASSTRADGGGGGGGSFVFVSGAAQPIAVAGGGGGAGNQFPTAGTDAQTGENGSTPVNTTYPGAGGTDGSGGQGGGSADTGGAGGGGAGWLGNGGNATNNAGGGGLGIPTFAGGSSGQDVVGGFGGGGGGSLGGGGGGGYSGGGGGSGVRGTPTPGGAGGGGGGSYLAASSTNTASAVVETGSGSFAISLLAASATPTITSAAQPASASFGSTIADKATVTGGNNPGGTVTFNLYNNDTATGPALFTDTENLSGGTATSAGFPTTATGTDYWVATYNGDSNNASNSSADAADPVTITGSLVVTSTSDSPTATGNTLRDALGYADSIAFSLNINSVSTSNNSVALFGNNGLITGEPVVYNTTGTVIGGLTNGKTYYVIVVDGTDVQLASTPAYANSSTYIPLSSSGTGTQTLNNPLDITFAAALTAGGAATVSLTTVGDHTAGPSDLGIDTNITILGPTGSNGITIANSGNQRLFYIAPAGDLTLDNLTLSGGDFIGGSSDGGGGGAGMGGAIFNAGTLNISQSTVQGNTAQGGKSTGEDEVGGGGLGGGPSGQTGGGPNGGQENDGGFGGGGGFEGNAGFGGGGGAEVTNAGFGGGAGDLDSAPGFGGGQGGGDLSTPGGGGAGMGGAIFNYGGAVTLTNSTLSNNSALGGTGANNGQGLGGAIFNLNGSVTSDDSTFAYNTAANGGGAIYNHGDSPGDVGSQSGGPALPSSAATVTLNNSILADSAASVSDFFTGTSNSGTQTIAGTNNLIKTGAANFTPTGGTPATLTGDPGLVGTSPASNGGPTPTFALSSGSPAIGMGITADYPGTTTPITTDQRGVPRPATPDIGAYQYDYSLVVNSTADTANDDNVSGPTVQLREAVNFVNTYAGAATITFSSALDGDTIALLQGQLALTDLYPLTIDASAIGGITISGNNASTVFLVDAGAAVTLNDLTITGGSVTNDDEGGGGIDNNGTLTVNNSTLSKDAASFFDGGGGGGIFNSGTLSVTNSTFSNDTVGNSEFGGGGLCNFGGGTATVINSTFFNDSAQNNGGGGISNFGTLTIADSTLAKNSAGTGTDGGGIWSSSGTTTLGNTIVAGNSSPNGADISGTVVSLGHNLIGNGDGSTGLTNGTNGDQVGTTVKPISALLAPLGNYGGPTQTMALLPGSPAIDAGANVFSEVQQVTIGGASTGFVSYSDDASTYSSATTASGLQSFLNSLSPISGAGGSVSVQLVSSANQVFVLDVTFGGSFANSPEPLLPLLGNLGTTVAVSEVLKGGPLPAADQRGDTRIVNATADIGAFESQGFTIAATSGGGQSTAPGSVFTNPLKVTVTPKNATEPVAGGMITFSAPTTSASATFGTNPITLAADGTGSTTATANSTPGGPYNVSASATGITTPATFSLTNINLAPGQYPGTPSANTTASYNNLGNNYLNAFDGNTNTFYDAPTANGNWVQLDLGSAKTISQIKYAPRVASGGINYEARMIGGIFEASNDPTFNSGVVTLYKITAQPADGLTTQTISATGTYRYVRYVAPAGSYGNIAEMQIFGPGGNAPPAATPLHATVSASAAGTSGNGVANVIDGNVNTFFDSPTANGNYLQLDLGSAFTLSKLAYAPRPMNGAQFEARMIGGVFEASNDPTFSTDVLTLYTVTTQPTDGLNTQALSTGSGYRYIRYVSPAGSYGDIAELEVFGTAGTAAPTPAAPGKPTLTGSTSTTASIAWTASPASGVSGYIVFRNGVQVGTTNSTTLKLIDTGLTPLTPYSYTVQAVANGVTSALSAALPVTTPAPTPVQLTGKVIGTAGSYQNDGNTAAKAFDGNTSTFFDAPTANGDWVGLDLGSAKTITSITFAPRAASGGFPYEARMVGGMFQVSNNANFSTTGGGVVDTLYTITSTPKDGYTTVNVTAPGAFEYVRYLAPNGSYGNIAEMQVFGH